MLCIKAEALHEDQNLASSSSSSPSTDRTFGNATFRLPINWYSLSLNLTHCSRFADVVCYRGSSIRRYLKKTGTFSRRSYSSGDGSLFFPHLDVNVPLSPSLSLFISLPFVITWNLLSKSRVFRGFGSHPPKVLKLDFCFWKQESKMLDQTSGRFDGKTKLWYKCELEQDVSHSVRSHITIFIFCSLFYHILQVFLIQLSHI